ncbi:MAG: hypothetical protein FJ318_08720 [SAR202 cluster bacterium]|nr:hypothetical protein [SAR202 cluster bacterium]
MTIHPPRAATRLVPTPLRRAGRLLDFESIGHGVLWAFSGSAVAALLGIWPPAGTLLGLMLGAASAVLTRWKHALRNEAVAVLLAWTAVSAALAVSLFAFVAVAQ